MEFRGARCQVGGRLRSAMRRGRPRTKGSGRSPVSVAGVRRAVRTAVAVRAGVWRPGCHAGSEVVRGRSSAAGLRWPWTPMRCAASHPTAGRCRATETVCEVTEQLAGGCARDGAAFWARASSPRSGSTHLGVAHLLARPRAALPICGEVVALVPLAVSTTDIAGRPNLSPSTVTATAIGRWPSSEHRPGVTVWLVRRTARGVVRQTAGG